MSTITPGYAICPKCNGNVPVYFILSFSSGPHSPIHTDFYRENYGSQIICYDLSICPNCLFVGPTEEFQTTDKALDLETPWEQLGELKAKYPPSRRYIMMAERLIKDGATQEKIANRFLRGGWAERMMENRGERSQESIIIEKECLSRAIQHLEEGIETGEIAGTADDLYLIGELSRRTDKFEKAIASFAMAKEKVKGEKYFCIFLDDMGANRNTVAQVIRELNDIAPNEPFKVSRKVGSKVVRGLTFEDADRKKQRLLSLGARVSIKEDDELAPQRERFLNLTDSMERYAKQRDSTHKIIKPEYISKENFERAALEKASLEMDATRTQSEESKDSTVKGAGAEYPGKSIALYTPEKWGGMSDLIGKKESLNFKWFEDIQVLVDYAKDKPFDLVIMDVTLKKMEKYAFNAEMVRVVKEAIPKCKVIGFSAIGLKEEDAKELIKAGVIDYFSIPFRYDELIGLIKRNLG